MSKPLITEDVAARYGWNDPSQVRKRVAKREIPHIKRAGDKRCFFNEEWLDAWDAGAELEVVVRGDGTRIVRPKAA